MNLFPSDEDVAYLKSCAPTSMARRMADAIEKLRADLDSTRAELAEAREEIESLEASNARGADQCTRYAAVIHEQHEQIARLVMLTQRIEKLVVAVESQLRSP